MTYKTITNLIESRHGTLVSEASPYTVYALRDTANGVTYIVTVDPYDNYCCIEIYNGENKLEYGMRCSRNDISEYLDMIP